MGTIARHIRRRMARRCQGHDVVVCALLLLSCSGEEVHEIKRENVAEIGAPRRAHVERVTSDVVQTAGCGWKSIGGGRGSLVVPSCEETRCSNSHRTRYECSLSVDENPPAKTSFGCSEEKVTLFADGRGTRFAYQTEPDGPWRLVVGGLAGGLFHPLGDAGRSLAFDEPPPKNGWAKVPAAETLLSALYVSAASQKHGASMPEGEVLAELRAHDPPGFVSRLAAFVDADVRYELCSGRTAWTSAVRELSPVERAALDAKLAPLLDDADAATPSRDHAFGETTPAAIVARFKDPGAWIRAHAKTSPVYAGIVLSAVSTRDPKTAATLGCALLAAEELEPAIRSASLLAVGRANVKCAAVKNHLYRALCRLHGEDDEILEPRTETEDSIRRIEENGNRVDVCQGVSEFAVALAVQAQGDDRATRAAHRELCRDDAPADAPAAADAPPRAPHD